MSADNIFVKSHVARDLLQSAGLFKTDKLVVWEYVSNGLQYVDLGTNAIVRVILDTKKRKITVLDNGRGMDWTGLKNFFVMHGENMDRREGRPGRGRFGTGKSAAFGIAGILRITTVHNAKRSSVELSRPEVEKMGSEEPIPVRVIEKETPTLEPNGTVIEIEDIHLRVLDQSGIIHYIERHLAKWPKGVTVFVNNHECEFAEPAVSQEKKFKPEGAILQTIGHVELVLKVSKAPLEQDLRGVSVFSKGVWYETTLAGSEGREMSQYIFGEIDVPGLDEDKSPIQPFDVSRSMRLNPNNEIVRAILSFIGQSVEEVRREIVDAEKRRKADVEMKRLAEHGLAIARVINEDFDSFRQHVAKVRAKAIGRLDAYRQALGGDDGDELVLGSELPAHVVDLTGGPGGGGGNGSNGGGPAPNLNPTVEPRSLNSDKKGRRAGGEGGRPKSSGGFRVEFKNLGIESHRAQYVRDERTIYINLDHPQVSAAKGLGTVEEPTFRHLSYEVAFSEYAIALASELSEQYIDPSDAIVDIRDTLNRLARRGAVLYKDS
jgi:hypothetical protein